MSGFERRTRVSDKYGTLHKKKRQLPAFNSKVNKYGGIDELDTDRRMKFSLQSVTKELY